MIAAALVDNGPMMFPENGPSYRSGWCLPALNEAQRDRIARLLPQTIAAVERSLVPATAAEIVTELTRLSLHFWQPDRPAAHFKMLIADYAADLADVPPDIFAEAIRQIRQSSQWFPKVADLVAITKPAVAKRQRELVRMRHLAGHVSGEPGRRDEKPVPFSQLPAERVKRFDEIMEAARQKLASVGP